MFITSLSKGLSSNENVSFKEIIRETKISDYIVVLYFYLFQIVIWPILLVIIIRNYVVERTTDFRNTFMWFAAIIVGVMVLLGINSAL